MFHCFELALLELKTIQAGHRLEQLAKLYSVFDQRVLYFEALQTGKHSDKAK
jgi:hypothetical protein